MERFEERRIVEAPIEVCWQVLTDAERAPDWVGFVSAARAEGPPGVGREQTVTGSLLGVSMDTSQTVDVWDEPSDYGWCADQPFPTRLRVHLDALDGQRTAITAAIEAEPGGVARVGARLAHRTIRWQFARSADRLAALLEDEADAA